jgi:hypothetical protein
LAHAEPEELAALATDPDDVDPDTRAHVSACDACGSSVAALADVRRAAGGDALVPAPAGMRERVLAEALAADVPAGGRPDPARRSTTARRRAVPLWAAGVAGGIAAALALVVGIGVGQVLGGADDAPPEETVVARTELTTVEGTAARGEARLLDSGGTVTLHVEVRAPGEEPGLREVWLLHVDGTRMVSVGLLPGGDVGDFEVPARLLEEGYRIVDVSLEPDDGDPTHSGDSVARGELT